MPKYKNKVPMAEKSHSGSLEAGNPTTNATDRSAAIVLEQLSGSDEQLKSLAEERRQAVNRRDGVWWSFLYGNFHPRRRSSRREVDKHHFLFDWHEPRILYLALGVLLLSCTDALFTLNLLKSGATEANAVMAAMLDESMFRFLSVKIGMTSASLLILVATARRKFYKSVSVEHLLQAFCIGYFLLICYEIYMFLYVFELKIF
jgi:hypothetical protein